MQYQEPKKVHVKLDCDVCGKPFKVKNRGSLTSWIFGEESVPLSKDVDKYCQCSDAGGTLNRAPRPAMDNSLNQLTVDESATSISISPTIHKPAFPPDENVGCKIGNRYEVLSVIGQGGMSTVYKVMDSVLGKPLALKLLRKELVSNEISLKRFEQEAKAVRSLTHPHLAAVYDYGNTENESPYLVMEYIEGESLSDLLKREIFLDVPRALAICLQICTAVAYAHENGVIHRDLKPENIILTNSGSDFDFVKLIDFGIAKVQTATGLTTQRVTQTGEIFGSPLYMSPEQCMGYPLDVRSDIYSLGCIMYELVTGKPPLAGENPVQTIFKHINETPASLAVEFKHLEIPRGFELLIMKALQKEPDERYQNIEDLRKDLKLVWLGKQPGSVSKTKSIPFYKTSKSLYVISALATTYAVGASILLWQQMNKKPEPPRATPKSVVELENRLTGSKFDPVVSLAPALLHEKMHEPFHTNQLARLDWRFARPAFDQLTFDLTFHNALPEGPVIFFRLYEGNIGKNHFYIGFQTDLHDPNQAHTPGPGMIYSRWNSKDPKDIRVVSPGGFADGNSDTPFIGVRRTYPWKEGGKYRVRLAQTERDETGVWYGLSIENLETKEVQDMGALKYPKEDGEYPKIKNNGWSLFHILRGVKYQKDIPRWHVSFNKVRTHQNLSVPENVNVDYKQSEAADIFVRDEGKRGSSIEVYVQPYAKNDQASDNF